MRNDNMKTTSETNWDYVRSLTDEQIDCSDMPPLGDEFFKNATLRMPKEKKLVLVEVDADTLAWYDAQGENKPASILAALRKYALDNQSLKQSA